MKKSIGYVFAAFTPLTFAAPSVDYQLSFPNATHHEADIQVTFSGLTGSELEVKMSRSSPGRYALHEFAKNVYQVTATDAAGEPLPVTRLSPYAWKVAGVNGQVKLNYTLFANRADGTYSGIDRTHAHLNMPATLMWATGLEDAPVSIAFKPFEPSWKVATQLVKTRDPYRFTAPDLAYLMDSPTELSNFDLVSWEQQTKGKSYRINLAVHHLGNQQDAEEFAEKAKAVVATQQAVFGELADYDYGEYTFIACYMPQNSSDGMEHRNSTYLVKSTPLHETELEKNGHIRTLSHEFFHSWNVERLRPKQLEPFDFYQANSTRSLWFAEGFTSYYGELTLRRTGETDNATYYQTLAGTINAVVNGNGPKYSGPQIMSLQAPFVDAATSIDPTNFSNTFLSYYTYGHGLGIALDLMIRQRFPGKSLDDYMRYAWQKLGKPEHPYTPDDLRIALGEALGNQPFADDFFARYVEGNEVPPYQELLAAAGLSLELAEPDTASAGPVRLSFEGKAAIIASNTLLGTPLYEAGLERGDQIVSLGRYAITDQARWDNALAQFKPGEQTEIRYIQLGEEVTTAITLRQNPELEVKEMPPEDLGGETGESFRIQWLGQPSED